jgi:hypothetical protein
VTPKAEHDAMLIARAHSEELSARAAVRCEWLADAHVVALRGLSVLHRTRRVIAGRTCLRADLKARAAEQLAGAGGALRWIGARVVRRSGACRRAAAGTTVDQLIGRTAAGPVTAPTAAAAATTTSTTAGSRSRIADNAARRDDESEEEPDHARSRVQRRCHGMSSSRNGLKASNLLVPRAIASPDRGPGP